MVENCEIFILNLYLAPPQGVTPSEFREDVYAGITKMIGLQYGEKNYDDMWSRFHLIRHGQTDGVAISISRFSVLTCNKNYEAICFLEMFPDREYTFGGLKTFIG